MGKDTGAGKRRPQNRPPSLDASAAADFDRPFIEAIKLAEHAEAKAVERHVAAVARARKAGLPWVAIAKAYGVSRQAVWERFAVRVEEVNATSEEVVSRDGGGP